MPDIPDWISAWDVRCVRQFQESIAVARKAVVDALDADTLASLRKGKTLVDEFSLNDEANSKELVARLKVHVITTAAHLRSLTLATAMGAPTRNPTLRCRPSYNGLPSIDLTIQTQPCPSPWPF